MKVKEITLRENYKVVRNDPQTGLELVDPAGIKMVVPPDQVAALQSNPQDPNKFTMSPDMLNQADQQQQGPQVGSEIELGNNNVAATETFDDSEIPQVIGGSDATDDLINDVTDHDFEDNAMSESELNAILSNAGLK